MAARRADVNGQRIRELERLRETLPPVVHPDGSVVCPARPRPDQDERPAPPPRTEAEQAALPPFKTAWARKRSEGYQYGGDALENVRFGYEIAASELARRESNG